MASPDALSLADRGGGSGAQEDRGAKRAGARAAQHVPSAPDLIQQERLK